MGHRLSRIYTRTGDDGTTGLGDGTRVDKTDARIEAYGTVDEANCAIGMAIAMPGLPSTVSELLVAVQHELFDLGGELAVPGYRTIAEEHVERLEKHLDRFNETLPPLKDFILPGGGPAAAACHLARSVVRRAERCAWAIVRREELVSPAEPLAVAPAVLRYLNRLSDLLFVLARVLARHEQGPEVIWKRSS
jgi:cob(I)alamin adenosyltransferase